jgi:hypothetical protein
MIFTSRLTSVNSKDSSGYSPAADALRDTVLDLLVGPYNIPPPSPKRRSKGEPVALSSASAMSKVEGVLWTLLSGSGYSLDMTVPVSKAEAAECLRQVKAILTGVDWGRREESFRDGTEKRSGKSETAGSLSSSHSSSSSQPQASHFQSQQEGVSDMADIDEFMTTLQMFSVCCKAIIHAYNAAEKKHSAHIEYQSLRDVVGCLSPGIASDLANGLLEAISHSSHRWRRRFEKTFEVSAPVERPSEAWGDSDESHRVHDRISSVRSIKQLKSLERQRFIHTTRAEIPGIALFSALCKHIPSYSVDVLLKVVEPQEQPARPVTQSTSSWSLWGSR